MTRSAGILTLLGVALFLAACSSRPYPPPGQVQIQNRLASASPVQTDAQFAQALAPAADAGPVAIEPPQLPPPTATQGATAQGSVSSLPVAAQALAPAAPAQPEAQLVQAAAPANVQPVYQAPVGGVRLRPGDEVEVRFFRNTELEGERYAVGVGDVLRVDVVDHPDLSRETVLVLPDGHISLPLVGSLRAAGRNVDELSNILADRYERNDLLEPQVQVAVTSSDQRLETLLALQEGGGLGTLRIVVSEDSILTLPFIPPVSVNQSMQAIVQQLRSAYWAEFGSRLEVTANLVGRGTQPLVCVMGEVLRPAAVEYESALNPMMAVAAAGGFLPTAEPEDVQVLRHGEDGSVSLWAFDLEAGLQGQPSEAATFRLEPRDVVYVRQSGIARANIWMQQNIRNMLPIDVGTGVFFNPLGDSD